MRDQPAGRVSARTRRSLAVVLLAVCASACAGIPHGGRVHVGRAVPPPGGLGDIDVRVLPAAAQGGLTPTEVVRGFLRALVNSDGEYEIARSYLTARAASRWNADVGVTTYDDSGVSISARPDEAASTPSSRTLEFRAPRVGAVDGRGNFTPQTGQLRAGFGLVKQNGRWRIDRLADGVLLSTLDAQRAFRPALVYYLNLPGTALVPEQVLLRPTPRGVTTALVRALLDGPGKWLAPSVRTDFPRGTALLGNVPADPDGVAEVNLSSVVRQASSAQLKALSAQLGWTLRQVSQITAVRLLADGSPLAVPGQPLDQPVSSWSNLNPAAPPAAAVAAFDRHGSWPLVRGQLDGFGGSTTGLSGVAIADDGRTIAGLRPHGRRVALLVGATGDRPRERVVADRLTDPTFSAAGVVVVVATNGGRRSVVAINPDGAVQHLATDPRLLAHPVRELRLSRDGARVAAVVGSARHGRLLVGRVDIAHGSRRFDAFRSVLPDAHDVRGLAWDGGDQLVVTAAEASGGREVVIVDVDGYGTRIVPTSGVRGQPSDVAVAPSRPLLVTAGRSVWIAEPSGTWRRVGSGGHPVYPD